MTPKVDGMDRIFYSILPSFHIAPLFYCKISTISEKLMSTPVYHVKCILSVYELQRESSGEFTYQVPVETRIRILPKPKTITFFSSNHPFHAILWFYLAYIRVAMNGEAGSFHLDGTKSKSIIVVVVLEYCLNLSCVCLNVWLSIVLLWIYPS